MKWIALGVIALTMLTQSCEVNDTEIIDNNPNITNPTNPIDTTTLEYFHNEYCYGFKVKDTTALIVMGKSQKRPNTDIDIKEGTTYLSGTRNGKLWIAGFETATKEQNFEFVDNKPMELKFKLYLGYGKYKDITINKTDIKYIVDNSPNFIISLRIYNKDDNDSYSSNAEYITFHTPSSSKTYSTQTAYGYGEPIEWYKGSYLLGGLDIEKPYENSSYIYACMTQTGDTIFTIKNEGSQNFAVDPAFPINYKEVIFFNSHQLDGSPAIHITKRNVDFPYANSTWDILTPIAYWLADAKYSITKKEISETVWQFTIDLLWYNGEKGSYSYKININTGELINNE